MSTENMIWRHSSLISTIYLINILNGQVEAVCPPPAPLPSTAIARLRQILFCDYDPLTRPVKNLNSTVSVGVSLAINDIQVEEHSETINVDGIVRMAWKDQFLWWNPVDYEGVSYLRLTPGEMWAPDLQINLVKQNGIEEMRPSSCVVSYAGYVTCMPKVSIRAPCQQDMRRWPYDRHNCSFLLSSFMYFEHQMNLSANSVDKTYYKRNSQWDLLETRMSRFVYNLSFTFPIPTYYPVLEYSFLVERHSGAFAAATVLPVFVLLTLILATFWMGTMVTSRVTICGFILMCTVTFLNYLLYLVPSNGNTVPVIITLFRDSFSLAAYAIIVAVSVKQMMNSERQPPAWISSVTDKLESSFVGRILLLDTATPTRDDEAAILETNAKPSPWASFALLLDRLSFCICSVVTIILLMAYVP